VLFIETEFGYLSPQLGRRKDNKTVAKIIFIIKEGSIGLTANDVHSFAFGGAILLRRSGRRVLNCVTKDKILFKSLIDKCRPVQKLNRITGDDRRFASPPAAAKLHIVRSFFVAR
jgi:hypothetical protein